MGIGRRSRLSIYIRLLKMDHRLLNTILLALSLVLVLDVGIFLAVQVNREGLHAMSQGCQLRSLFRTKDCSATNVKRYEKLVTNGMGRLELSGPLDSASFFCSSTL